MMDHMPHACIHWTVKKGPLELRHGQRRTSRILFSRQPLLKISGLDVCGPETTEKVTPLTGGGNGSIRRKVFNNEVTDGSISVHLSQTAFLAVLSVGDGAPFMRGLIWQQNKAHQSLHQIKEQSLFVDGGRELEAEEPKYQETQGRDVREEITEDKKVIKKIINLGDRYEKPNDEIHKQWRMTKEDQTYKPNEDNQEGDMFNLALAIQGNVNAMLKHNVGVILPKIIGSVEKACPDYHGNCNCKVCLREDGSHQMQLEITLVKKQDVESQQKNPEQIAMIGSLRPPQYMMDEMQVNPSGEESIQPLPKSKTTLEKMQDDLDGEETIQSLAKMKRLR
eukprot:Gb_08458 [translate_table: standard]